MSSTRLQKNSFFKPMRSEHSGGGHHRRGRDDRIANRHPVGCGDAHMVGFRDVRERDRHHHTAEAVAERADNQRGDEQFDRFPTVLLTVFGGDHLIVRNCSHMPSLRDFVVLRYAHVIESDMLHMLAGRRGHIRIPQRNHPADP